MARSSGASTSWATIVRAEVLAFITSLRFPVVDRLTIDTPEGIFASIAAVLIATVIAVMAVLSTYIAARYSKK